MDFLVTLERSLKLHRVKHEKDDFGRHACVAAIFRVRSVHKIQRDKELQREKLITTAKELFEQEWTKDGLTQILYIKRSVNKSDRWSGDVAFPGGRRQDSDESDQATAERETLEEIGLDLSDRSKFVCLGQIDDLKVIRGRNVKSLVVSCFVFLQTTPETPKLTLQTKEIAAFRWVDIRSLVDSPRMVTISYSPHAFYPKLKVPSTILRFAGFDPIHFPATPLQPTEPSIDEGEDGATPFNLWGMTLGRTSEILQLAQQPRLDRPRFVTNNVLANMLIRLKYGPCSRNGIHLPLLRFSSVASAAALVVATAVYLS
eukprot:TRINITY_DN7137_c0_g1_i1.p1 TRINITY_DN7137_c0_g1~~TRINITY_DN7137_c0_g1_i1.p1  ORF type:complete len:315 (+),score=62.32 TRINITY_DN7137_c0_g1_i1:64-1008(+)